MTIFYAPLEDYKERYTGQLRHWMQVAFSRANKEATDAGLPRHDVVTVEGERGSGAIKTGQVLDAGQRVRWATEQIKRLSRAIDAGSVKDGDHIHLDDFWHPGLDSLWYMLDSHNLYNVWVSAFCWAQSVDCYDFTHKMRFWMRDGEKMHGNRIRWIFVADEQLRELLVAADIGGSASVKMVGLPFDSAAIQDIHYGVGQRPFWLPEHKKRKVVFSSRFDSEKDPEFFLQVARWVKEASPDTEFVMCSSATEVRSNASYLREKIKDAVEDGTVTLKLGLSKKEYYDELVTARVQFNSALQDWVSFTLLEAVTFGCWPIYPMYRSFPAALRHESTFMYRPGDEEEAANMVGGVLDTDQFFTDDAVKARQQLILPPHDAAIPRMLSHMGLRRRKSLSEFEWPEDEGLKNWKAWRADQMRRAAFPAGCGSPGE